MIRNLLSAINKHKLTIMSILVLVVFSISIRLIKANFFSVNHDEMWGLIRIDSLAKTMDSLRIEVVPPLGFVLNVLIRQNFGDHLIAFRMPHIIVGTLTVLLFYVILRKISLKNAFLLSLIPATNFMMVYYSQEIKPYSYALLFTLLVTFLGYFLLARSRTSTTQLLILASAYNLLPMIHYFAIYYLLALDITLTIFILLFSQKRIVNMFNLILVNLFSLYIFIPWADILEKNIRGNILESPNQPFKYHFGVDTLKELSYSFFGGGDLWLRYSLAICLIGLVTIIFKIGRKFVGNYKLKEADTFLIFNLVCFVVFFFAVSRIMSWRFLFARYYLYLIWPFIFLLVYTISNFLESKNRLLMFVGYTAAISFIISNSVNSVMYLKSNSRFGDWRELANFSRELSKSGKKQIIINNPAMKEDVDFYLRDMPNLIIGANAVDLNKQLDCCLKETAYIYIQNKERNDSAFIATMAKKFEHQKTFWEEPSLRFLTNRKVSPYYNLPLEFGGYAQPIVFY